MQQTRTRATDLEYVDSIEDPFFRSVARGVLSVDFNTDTASEEEKASSATRRLEDLEISARKKLLELLLSLQDDSTGDHGATNIPGAAATTGARDDAGASDAIGVFWKSSLDLCHHLVHYSVCSSPSPPKPGSNKRSYENLAGCRRLPYLLLSDCLEGLPSLADAQRFWGGYVEPELGVLFADKFWSALTKTNNPKKLALPSSHLPFLKVANQFLKRLEHASSNVVRAEWKGRILWALSKGFSVADKSSLKLWGNFHTTNGTDFESKEEFHQQTTTTTASIANNNGAAADYNLYEAFWSLQNDFANPNKINVVVFIKRLRLVLAEMESATTTTVAAAPVAANRNTTTENKISSPEHDKDEHERSTAADNKETTKYLTSSALLPSQIYDPSFRSSVVAQFLIVASHLGAESPPLKNALSGLLGRARKLLKNDNPRLHEILWDFILGNGREDHWRTWKKQKCAAAAFAPNFKRSAMLVLDSPAGGGTAQESSNRKRKLARDVDNGKGSDGGVIRSSTSRRFSDNNKTNDPNSTIPTLEEHLEPYVEALDPESGIEDEYHPKNDSLFTWRAMRLYAKHQLPLVGQCRQPDDLEKITRVWHRRFYGKDIPGAIKREPSDENDDDMEKKDEMVLVEVPTEDDNENGDSKNKSSNMDTEMNGQKAQEEPEKEKTDENSNGHKADAIDKAAVGVKIEDPDVKMEDAVTTNDKKMEEDPPKADKTEQRSKPEAERSETIKTKKEDPEPPKQRKKRTGSSTGSDVAKSKTDGNDELNQRVKNSEVPKPKPAANKASTDGRKNGQEQHDNNKGRNKNSNKKNDSQRHDKHSDKEQNGNNKDRNNNSSSNSSSNNNNNNDSERQDKHIDKEQSNNNKGRKNNNKNDSERQDNHPEKEQSNNNKDRKDNDSDQEQNSKKKGRKNNNNNNKNDSERRDKNPDKEQKNNNSDRDNNNSNKNPPRDNFTAPSRSNSGGRRGNIDGGRSSQERGRRDDAPPPRWRGDDNSHPRVGGRSGGGESSSYNRGRDNSSQRGGGRYDDDYRSGDSNRHHSDSRGVRFEGERGNRSVGRDNHRGSERRDNHRGGDRGVGRDDNRGGDRGGDRERRNIDTRSRAGGGGDRDGGRRRR